MNWEEMRETMWRADRRATRYKAAMFVAICLALVGWTEACAGQTVVDRCIASRPCNWSSHAAIAGGVTWALDEVGLNGGAAAGVAVLLFAGKEVRDHLKWGYAREWQWDLGSAVLGAAVVWLWKRR